MVQELWFRKHPQVLRCELQDPHGGLRPLHQRSTCITQLICGPFLVRIWPRGGHVPLRIEGNESLVLHRVDPTPDSLWGLAE